VNISVASQKTTQPMPGMTLILNSGSSSLKFKLFDMPAERELAWGMVERIGERRNRARLVCNTPHEHCAREVTCADHTQALRLILEGLAHTPHRCDDIRLAGHRLVHGKDLFTGPTLIDTRALARMAAIQDLAPLHMPPALDVVRASMAMLPRALQVACFDTTFHLSMPAHTYRYAVPQEWYSDHGVRRFGFHGLSHHYVTVCASQRLGIPLEELKLITAHLGNGASITAFERGRVLDTSMGFTPLEGLIMGTRAGYLDPAVLAHVQRRTGLSLEEMIEILNTRSGLAAISGLSRDLRTIMAARAEGHADAALAVEMYVHTLRKYVGAYAFALRGVHAVVFTGGVGENAFEIREWVLDGLEEMGLILDDGANRQTVNGRAGRISADHSRIQVLIIPTDEERMIARQASQLATSACESHSNA